MKDKPMVQVDRMKVLDSKSGKVRAFADLQLAGHYVIRGLRVVEGSKGLFVSMPSVERNGTRWDMFKPITKEGNEEIRVAVMAAYDKAAKAQAVFKGGGN